MADDASASAGTAPLRPEPIAKELRARLTPAQQDALKRTLWRERFLSLWAPITIFGVLLALYILIVELHTPAAKTLKPVMDGLGLLALLALFALAVLRYGVRRFGELRAARHEAREAIAELEGIFSSRVIRDPKRTLALDQAQAIEVAYPLDDAKTIRLLTEKLNQFMEKDLGRKKYGADFVIGFVKAFAIAMLIRSVIIEPFKIPSGSMIPTLEIGDQIFVNKFIYGVRLPFTNYVPFKIIREPRSGDVIVFENPVDSSKDFIKRVIAVPGDKVEIRANQIFINGKPMPRELVAQDFVTMDQRGGQWTGDSSALYREDLSGHEHMTLQSHIGSCNGGNVNDGQAFVVPERSVFVMGDNRDNSSDSRYGLGSTSSMCQEKLTYVPYGNIKGKAMVIWLSLSYGGVFSNLFGGTGLRTDRLFLPVR